MTEQKDERKIGKCGCDGKSRKDIKIHRFLFRKKLDFEDGLITKLELDLTTTFVAVLKENKILLAPLSNSNYLQDRTWCKSVLTRTLLGLHLSTIIFHEL